ncbi:zinc finger protein 59-like [Uranotaenia lowii]|uniref:zinc finger protein 59-like n=1 Tax=Uranotaenia lowii TaxID=190385 RepID=UPI00247AE375|nr:zinc finger protein 59-like [Uranotaenia lowii]
MKPLTAWFRKEALSTMSCIVPYCDSVEAENRMRDIPSSRTLAKRWLQAIQMGCQLAITSRNGSLARSGKVCDKHFDDTDRRFSNEAYSEPTIFYDREGNLTIVATCRICFLFFLEKDMILCRDFIKQLTNEAIDRSLPETIGKLFGLRSKTNASICFPCAANIQLIQTMQPLFENFKLSNESLKQIINHEIQAENSTARPKRMNDLEKDGPAELERSVFEIGSENQPFIVLNQKCYLCKVCFSSKLELHNHLIQHHPKSAEFRCNVCQKMMYDVEIFNRHLSSHSEEELFRNGIDCFSITNHRVILEKRKSIIYSPNSLLECRNCDMTFRMVGELGKHSLEVHGDDKPYACPHCELSYANNGALRRHISEIHENQPRMNKITNQFNCFLCKMRFLNRTDLTTHISGAHGNEEYPYLECPDCPRTFICRQSLVQHRNIHTDKYVCKKCGKHFSNFKALQTHRDGVHSRSPNFRCDICKQLFTTGTGLQSHRKKHFRKSSNECEICRMIFINKYSLNCHRQTHLDKHDLTFVCSECNETFITNDDLRHHRQSSHPRQRLCEICNRSFPNMSALRQHKILHITTADFECHVCHKSFKTDRYLSNHLKAVHPTRMKRS